MTNQNTTKERTLEAKLIIDNDVVIIINGKLIRNYRDVFNDVDIIESKSKHYPFYPENDPANPSHLIEAIHFHSQKYYKKIPSLISFILESDKRANVAANGRLNKVKDNWIVTLEKISEYLVHLKRREIILPENLVKELSDLGEKYYEEGYKISLILS